MLEVLIDFLVIFVIVCLVYLLFINRSKKDFNKLKPNDFIRMFVLKYNIDINKINYNFMVNLIAIINSFIIAITSAIIIIKKMIFLYLLNLLKVELELFLKEEIIE